MADEKQKDDEQAAHASVGHYVSIRGPGFTAKLEMAGRPVRSEDALVLAAQVACSVVAHPHAEILCKAMLHLVGSIDPLAPEPPAWVQEAADIWMERAQEVAGDPDEVIAGVPRKTFAVNKGRTDLN